MGSTKRSYVAILSTGAAFNLLVTEEDKRNMRKIEQHFNKNVPEVRTILSVSTSLLLCHYCVDGSCDSASRVPKRLVACAGGLGQ